MKGAAKDDIIVVLGSFVETDMEPRVRLASRLLRKMPKGMLILVGTKEELALMKRFALNHDLPHSIVNTEVAFTTLESALCIRKIMEMNDFRGDVILVTSKYHEERAVTTFRAVLYPHIKIKSYCVPNSSDDFGVIARENKIAKLVPFLQLLNLVDTNNLDFHSSCQPSSNEFKNIHTVAENISRFIQLAHPTFFSRIGRDSQQRSRRIRTLPD